MIVSDCLLFVPVPGVRARSSRHGRLQKYKYHQVFTEEEFSHWILPKDGVVYSYVVEKDGQITDMVSFYNLPSTIIGNDKYKTLYAAYFYYTVANVTPLADLITDAMISANSLGFDVYNALDLMENGPLLRDLKFGIGDGRLQYYIYNWQCPQMMPKEVGLILL